MGGPVGSTQYCESALFTCTFVPLCSFLLQFSSPGDFLHSPKLQPSQGTPGSDELLFSRRRPSRNPFQNSVDFSSERSSLCAGEY